jgi:hypothetical protein
MAGSIALLSGARPSEAAFGEAARVRHYAPSEHSNIIAFVLAFVDLEASAQYLLLLAAHWLDRRCLVPSQVFGSKATNASGTSK